MKKKKKIRLLLIRDNLVECVADAANAAINIRWPSRNNFQPRRAISYANVCRSAGIVEPAREALLL